MLQLQGPLTVTDILDGAFRIYRTHFARLVLIAAIFMVPVAVATTLLLGFTVSSANDLFFASPSETDFGGLAPGLGALFAYFGLGLLGYAAMAMAFVSLLAYIVALLHGEQLTVGESIRRGLRRFWAFVGMVLLVSLALGAATFGLYLVLALIFGIFAVFIGLLANAGDAAGVAAAGFMIVAVFVYLGAVVLVLAPIGLLAARWVAAPAAVVAEHLGPRGSMDRSWALTRGRAWRGFGFLVVLTIFNFVVLGLPVTLLQWLLMFALTTQWYGWLSGLLAGLTYFVNILWYPLLVLALTLLYYDLRIRAESLDLDHRIRRLEQAAGVTVPDDRSVTSPGASGAGRPADTP
jgi:hypothetical protein